MVVAEGETEVTEASGVGRVRAHASMGPMVRRTIRPNKSHRHSGLSGREPRHLAT